MPEWEHVIFIGPAFVKENLQLKENMRFVSVDDRLSIPHMTTHIQKALGDLFGEVGVNLYSGNGALHMAVLSAILKAGGGIKLVHYGDTFEEL